MDHLKYLTKLTSDAIGAVLENYSLTAILLHSVKVAEEHYEGLFKEGEDSVLDTLANVPPEFRMPLLDVANLYTMDQLVETIRTDIVEKISTDYLIHTVAILDKYFEDVCQYFVEQFLEGEKMRRVIWRNDFVRNVIKRVPVVFDESELVFDCVIDRYEELRELRNAVLHQKGIVSPKKLDDFKKSKEIFKEAIGREDVMTFVDHYVVDGKVKVNPSLVVWVRKAAYTLLAYLQRCYIITPKINTKNEKTG